MKTNKSVLNEFLLFAMNDMNNQQSKHKINQSTNIMNSYIAWQFIKKIYSINNKMRMQEIKQKQKRKKCIKEPIIKEESDELIIEYNTIYEIDKLCEPVEIEKEKQKKRSK